MRQLLTLLSMVKKGDTMSLLNQFVIYGGLEYLVVEEVPEEGVLWLSDQYGEEFPVYRKELD